MINPVICLEMLFENETPENKIRKITESGFNYIEFWSWRDKDIGAVRSACDQWGAQIVNFSGQRAGDLVNTATHEILLDDYNSALNAAKILEVKTMMVLTNELGEGGVVVNPYDEFPLAEKEKAVVEGLKKLSKLIPEDSSVVLEPLNTVKDHVGYYLDNMEIASHIIEQVGDPRIKILCDFYHQGMMGDDLAELINNYIDKIGYIHIADFPGRHEPGTGLGDWENILWKLKESGYEGYVGFEYQPESDSAESMAVIKELWDSVFQKEL